MNFTILVLDDDQVLLDLMTEVLEQEEGYIALGCTSAAQAEHILHSLTPDMLIIDGAVFKSAAGSALVQQLRHEHATLALPIIVYSADQRLLQDSGAQIKALDCALVAKPFVLDSLLTMIELLLTTSHSSNHERAVGER